MLDAALESGLGAQPHMYKDKKSSFVIPRNSLLKLLGGFTVVVILLVLWLMNARRALRQAEELSKHQAAVLFGTFLNEDSFALEASKDANMLAELAIMELLDVDQLARDWSKQATDLCDPGKKTACQDEAQTLNDALDAHLTFISKALDAKAKSQGLAHERMKLKVAHLLKRIAESGVNSATLSSMSQHSVEAVFSTSQMVHAAGFALMSDEDDTDEDLSDLYDSDKLIKLVQKFVGSTDKFGKLYITGKIDKIVFDHSALKRISAWKEDISIDHQAKDGGYSHDLELTKSSSAAFFKKLVEDGLMKSDSMAKDEIVEAFSALIEEHTDSLRKLERFAEHFETYAGFSLDRDILKVTQEAWKQKGKTHAANQEALQAVVRLLENDKLSLHFSKALMSRLAKARKVVLDDMLTELDMENHGEIDDHVTNTILNDRTDLHPVLELKREREKKRMDGKSQK